MGSLLSLWFGFQAAVNRRTYILSGFGLMGLKFALDNLIIYTISGSLLAPQQWLNPVISMRYAGLDASPNWMSLVLAAVAIPFIWVGVSMTVRRAVDAGWSPWTGLLFLFPVVNYMVMLALCAAPSAEQAASSDSHAALDPTGNLLKSALLASLVMLTVAILIMVLNIFVLGEYGSALFVGTPFLMGTLGAWLVHRDGYRGLKTSLLVGLIGVVVGYGALLVFALEGLICLGMAAPLVIPLTLIGSVVGDMLAKGPASPAGSVSTMAFALPLLAALPLFASHAPPVRSVTTSLDIAASPEKVWQKVIAFEELPTPEHWLFRAGMAAPVAATIDGEGVGSIRTCSFTTGDFVEPITAWDPPHRLAFDVTEQPPSMKELGLWPVVHAPHLHGGMKSHRGEFRLERLAEGGTRLHGTTWYTLHMAPKLYWHLYSDAIVHLIHTRVLEHIATLSEKMVPQR